MADKFTSGRIDTHEYIAKLKQSEATKATLSDVETLLASGDVPDIKADSIVENMEGYSFEKSADIENIGDYLYAGVVKNGNKLTFALFMKITPTEALEPNLEIGNYNVPADVYAKLIPTTLGTAYEALDVKYIPFYTNLAGTPALSITINLEKRNNKVRLLGRALNGLSLNTTYLFRYEATFLLSDNLVPSD